MGTEKGMDHVLHEIINQRFQTNVDSDIRDGTNTQVNDRLSCRRLGWGATDQGDQREKEGAEQH